LLRAQVMQRMAECGPSDQRFLLAECEQAYLGLAD
jgi:hypothetical protein